jgi:hypothetical protein
MPDGEQVDWVFAAYSQLAGNPGLQAGEGSLLTTADTPFGGMRSLALSFRGSPQDVSIERFGYADAIAESYDQLTGLKQRGIIPGQVRLQATLASPGTVGGILVADWADMVSVIQPPLIAEVEGFARAVPLPELAVQFDLAAEIEQEEWRRNPDGFGGGTPFLAALEQLWGSADLAALLCPTAELASRVPEAAELGFHLCSIWHIDPRAGQDLAVHVDAANLLAEQVSRRIDYIHMPVLPEHQPADYAKLAGLRLGPDTKVFLGLIHDSDGLAGARERIRMAADVLPDFGIAYFCGMRDLNQADPERLDDLLELHRMLAEL